MIMLLDFLKNRSKRLEFCSNVLCREGIGVGNKLTKSKPIKLVFKCLVKNFNYSKWLTYPLF